MEKDKLEMEVQVKKPNRAFWASWYGLWLVGAVFFFAFLYRAAQAFAQDAGPSSGPVPYDPNDPSGSIDTFFDAIAHKNWWALVAIGITVFVWGIRKIAAKWDVLQGRVAGWVLNIGTGLLVSLIGYFSSITTFTWPSFGTAALTALKLLATSGIIWHGLLDTGVAKKPETTG